MTAHPLGSRSKPGIAPLLPKPSPAHSIHPVGDATQGWDPVADAPFTFYLLGQITPPREEKYSCPCGPSPLRIPSIADKSRSEGSGNLCSHPLKVVQTYPHLTPPQDLVVVVHEVQASPPQVASNDVGWGLGGASGGVSEWGRRYACEGLLPSSG
jgi:hypothetical protein